MGKKNKSYNFIVPLVVYPFDVMVSVGQGNKELKALLKKYNIPIKDYFDIEVTKGRATLFCTKQILIRFKDDDCTTHNLIAHEVFHAVTLILDEVGMPFKIDDNDEAYAY